LIDRRQQPPAEIGKQRFLLFGFAATALVSETLYLTLVRFDAIDGFRPVATFVGLMMALFAVYGIAFLLIERIRLWKKAAILIVVLGSLCFRITMIPAGLPNDVSATEMLELVRADLHGTAVSFDRYLLYDDDIWRYLWDGHVWANAENPFLYAPVDPRLDPLTLSAAKTEGMWPDIRDNINHASIPTIYPPLAQLVFRISHAIAPGSIVALKTILVLLDLSTMCLVWLGLEKLGLPSAWLLLYGWNPLLIKTVAASGHVDILAGTMLALAAYFLLVRAKLPAAIALAGACLAKLSPIVLLPFAVKRIGWRNSFTAILLIVAGYVPFLGGGTAIFSGLSRFAREWQFNSAFFLAIRALARPFIHDPSFTARGAGVLAVVATAIWLLRRDDGEPSSFPRVASSMLAALILFSPTVIPWYLIWLLPLAVLARASTWIWFTAIVCLAFFVMVDGTERIAVVAMEYGWLLAVALAIVWHRKNRRARHGSQIPPSSSTTDQTLSPLFGVTP
jgi:alpha-1,6-mannosyltransferase